MIKYKKSLLLFSCLLFSISYFLLGCEKYKQPCPTRLLLDWLPNPNHVPLYVGLEKGFFKELGIDLGIQKMHEGGSGISYLVSKKADLLINHMPGTLKACEKGAKLKIIGLLIKEPLCGLTYRADNSIQTPKDLSGKIFGYCIGGPDIDFLNFLLTNGNIQPKVKKNVSVDLVSAMATRSVDFIYGGFWNIEPAHLNGLGLETKTFKIQELGVPLYYEMIILANANSAYASPEFVLRFQDALQKSIDFCQSHPEEAFACFLAYNRDIQPKTIAWQKEAWDLTCPLFAKNQSIDTEVVREFYSWQLSRDIISDRFDYKELIEIR